MEQLGKAVVMIAEVLSDLNKADRKTVSLLSQIINKIEELERRLGKLEEAKE